MRPELQGIVEEAARLLGVPITLEDRAFDLVAYGSQRADVDAVRQGSILQRRSPADVRTWFEQFGITSATGPVRTPADPEHGIAARLCVPVRWRGVTYGYLWAYGWTQALDDALDDARRAQVIQLAEHAGSLLAALSRSRESNSSLLTDLLSGDAEQVRSAVAAIEDRELVRPGVPVVVVVAGADEVGRVADGADGTSDAPLSLNLWRLPRSVLAAGTGARTTLLVPLRDTGSLDAAQDVAARTLELYAERTGDTVPLVAGIGAARRELRSARGSWREARLALRVAGAVPALRPVATWDELGVYRLLAADPQPDLLLDAPVRALLAEPELARTALAYLQQAGSAAATAAELGIHRQTLYYRLARIDAVTGLQLRSGSDRLRLHLALTLAPLL